MLFPKIFKKILKKALTNGYFHAIIITEIKEREKNKMMYALYKNEFEYGELMDVTIIACADSIEKLIAYYEQLENKQAKIIFEEADYGYAAQWIIKDTYYRIQKLKIL